LPAKHGHQRKKPLVAGASALVVVHEFERTFLQLHDRHVGQRAKSERAAVIPRLPRARRQEGSRLAADNLLANM
jgi:hypothetical protein